jgi:hypothetical protein
MLGLPANSEMLALVEGHVYQGASSASSALPLPLFALVSLPEFELPLLE